MALLRAHMLLIVMLAGVSGLCAQEYVILQHQRQPAREHKIKLPQYMIFTYDTGKKQYRVVKMDNSGIFTEKGPVDMDYTSFSAKIEKPKGEVFFGRTLLGIGFCGVLVASVMNTDTSKELATSGILMGSSIVVFIIGGRIARTKYKYKPDTWHIKETPVEFVKAPINRELKNPRFLPPDQ